MLKKLHTLFASSVLLAGLIIPVCAQDDEGETAGTEQAQEAEVISIENLLKEVKYVTKVKPRKKPAVYFFLRSHANCGFCRMITPKMNESYKEMKGKGAEIIMLNGDPDTESAKKWADETGIEIPMITPETAGVVGAKVPAGGSGSTPNITAVIEDGIQLENTSGAKKCSELVSRWKDMVKEAKKLQKEKAAEAKKAAKKKAKKKKKKAKKTAAGEKI